LTSRGGRGGGRGKRGKGNKGREGNADGPSWKNSGGGAKCGRETRCTGEEEEGEEGCRRESAGWPGLANW